MNQLTYIAETCKYLYWFSRLKEVFSLRFFFSFSCSLLSVVFSFRQLFLRMRMIEPNIARERERKKEWNETNLLLLFLYFVVDNVVATVVVIFSNFYSFISFFPHFNISELKGGREKYAFYEKTIENLKLYENHCYFWMYGVFAVKTRICFDIERNLCLTIDEMFFSL